MHYYRALPCIAAMTFDLDDTLYDNRPVIERTEQQSLAFLQHYHPALRELQTADLWQVRQQLRVEQPEIYHDVTQWRWFSIYVVLQQHGLSEAQAREGADGSMAEFARWRSQITIPQSTHQILRALAARYPLAVITNGNAQPAACGLDSYFRFVFHAGQHGRAKPFGDMYQQAAQRLGVAPETILHVGDDLITDVQGAVESGLSACWINDRQRELRASTEARILPHIEISQLASLTALL